MHMSEWQLKTPVVFLVFNRPDTTEKVFQEIRRARPPQLLVVADGPRLGRKDDAEKCAAVRAVIERADWPCMVLKNYSDGNMGCKQRISSGLDWAFTNVEEAIILEDDCLPDPSFFRFCEELLDYYRHDSRVMIISGDNFQFGKRRSQYSYYFSRYAHIWGWATWRRAWDHYDVDMRQWVFMDDRFQWLQKHFIDRKSAAFWERTYNAVSSGDINTWDFQLTFSCWLRNGLAIIPGVNLVSNIGFSEESTHTRSRSPYACIKSNSVEFPMRHPPEVLRDVIADRYIQRTHYNPGIIRTIFRLFSAMYQEIMK